MKKPGIVAIGSINMDIVIEAERFPKVGETLIGDNVSFIPGGKGANQAVASARLGADTAMIGAVGADSFGNQMLKSLRDNGVNVGGVRQTEEAATGLASIYVAEGDNNIVVVPGANGTLETSDIDRNEELIHAADIVLLQLEVPVPVVQYAARKAKELGKTVILNPAPASPLPDELYTWVDYFTPNRHELALYAEMEGNYGQLEAGMQKMKKKGVHHIITTLGGDGSAFLDQEGRIQIIDGYRVSVTDTTGAGDCFNAALAAAIARGKSIENAAAYATAASALAVTKFGAQAGMPYADEIEAFLQRK